MNTQLRIEDMGIGTIPFGPSTLKGSEVTAETEEDLLGVELTMEEIRALSKTVGIAAENLHRKLAAAPKGSMAHKTAADDLRLLLSAQEELTATIKENI